MVPFISAKLFASWREPTQRVEMEVFIKVFKKLVNHRQLMEMEQKEDNNKPQQGFSELG